MGERVPMSAPDIIEADAQAVAAVIRSGRPPSDAGALHRVGSDGRMKANIGRA